MPVIWDLDFLNSEDESYVLCEINVSSTFAFPEVAMPGVARAALDQGVRPACEATTSAASHAS